MYEAYSCNSAHPDPALFLLNMPHVGELRFGSGLVAEGDFQNGFLQGAGRMEIPDIQMTYHGDFKEGIVSFIGGCVRVNSHSHQDTFKEKE